MISVPIVLTLCAAMLCSASVGSVYAIAPPAAAALGIFESHQDIGLSLKPGMILFDAGAKTYQVTGSGANIWSTSDAFQFAYARISGDVTFSADVRFVGKGTDLHRKAALMIRQSLQPEAAYADVALQGDGLTALQYRPSVGVETSEFRAAMKAPLHLSITRRGHEFTILAGNRGEEPALNGPVIVVMQDPVYLGLAVCSHNADVMETAMFSNVKMIKSVVR